MDFSLTPDQQAIRDAIARICARFGDDYWLGKDRSGGFLVLDGVYRTTEGVPVFHAVRAPTPAELQALLTPIIKFRKSRLVPLHPTSISHEGDRRL